MIKLNDNFEFERDNYGWALHRYHDSTSRKGEPTRVRTTTYHSVLSQVCNEMLDKETGNCESLKEIIQLLKSVNETMVANLTDHIKEE